MFGFGVSPTGRIDCFFLFFFLLTFWLLTGKPSSCHATVTSVCSNVSFNLCPVTCDTSFDDIIRLSFHIHGSINVGWVYFIRSFLFRYCFLVVQNCFTTHKKSNYVWHCFFHSFQRGLLRWPGHQGAPEERILIVVTSVSTIECKLFPRAVNNLFNKNRV